MAVADPPSRVQSAVLLALVVLAAFAACRPERASSGPAHPNVLVILLDTTRRDHLSLHGYERETSPNLEELAPESAVFTRAYSTSCWTSPAHASLFTGLYPAAHHVTQEAWRMPAELVTLAEAFAGAGYRTAAMVGNPMVGRGLGFDQGFQVFHETWREEDVGDARRHPAVEGLRAVVEARDERPFFAFVNLIEPHSPYDEGPYIRDFDRHPTKGRASNKWRAFFTGAASFTREDFEHLVDRYDGEVRYADEIAGALVDLLRERGLLEDTLLVVTSDHGENFGEHGLVDHCFNLYEETTRVPLVIRYPRVFPAGQRDDPVQLLDLAPTLLAVAGVPSMEGMQGLDLSRGPVPADRAVLLYYGYPKQALTAFKGSDELGRLQPYLRRLWALRSGDWKLIVGSDGRRELYDLAADPRELHDLADAEAERTDELDRLREALFESVTRGEARPMDASEIDEETWKEMRELGYAGER